MTRLKYLIYAFQLLMAATVMVACSTAEPAEPARHEAMIQIEVLLPSYGSRATPEGDYDPGISEWENYIDLERDLRIYFFSSENAYIGCMHTEDMHVSTVPVTGTSNYKRFNVICKVEEDLLPTDVKILLLANYGNGNYPEDGGANRLKIGDTYVQTLSELYSQLTYQITQPYVSLSRDNCIPMFGIRQCSDLHVVKGEQTNVGTIHMLRAMAKVEVMADVDEVSDLHSVELEGYNTSGYLAPLNVFKQSDYVTGSWDTDYTSTPSIPSGIADGSGNKKAFGKQGSKFVIYVPEYFNTDSDGNPLAKRSKMKLVFADNTSHEYTLEFKDYETDKYFDIKRNYYYKYTVRRKADDPLIVEVEVHPYSVVDLKPEYGIETGTPLWEGMWLVGDTPLAFDEMSARYFDWSTVQMGQILRIYILSRAPGASPNLCTVSVRRYRGEGNITGLETDYVNPDHGVIEIELTEEILNDILANDGISLVCKYLILYRIAIK